VGPRGRGGLPPNGYLVVTVLLGFDNTEYVLLPACQNRCQAIPVAASIGLIAIGLIAKDHSGEIRFPALQGGSLKTREGGPSLTIFVCTISTEGAPTLAFFARVGGDAACAISFCCGQVDQTRLAPPFPGGWPSRPISQ